MTLLDISAIGSAVVGFDYGSLPPSIASEARSTAERIRTRISGSVIETGRDLLAMKAKLEHGQFEKWIEAEFSMTSRSARNYMSAASAFGAKSEIISDLPLSTIYSLAAATTPREVRDDVVSRLEAGERLDPKQIAARVEEAREEMRRGQEPVSKKAERERERRADERRAADFQREMEGLAKESARRKEAAASAVDYLRGALGLHFAEFQQLFADADAAEFAALLARAVAEPARPATSSEQEPAPFNVAFPPDKPVNVRNPAGGTMTITYAELMANKAAADAARATSPA